MSDYIKHKEYKLPNGRTVTADFNELGEARVTIEAMDYLMDMFNSLVEVVRCKDCKKREHCRTTNTWVECANCGVSTRIYDDPDEVVEFWNRRSDAED